jgi:hypothetical protein
MNDRFSRTVRDLHMYFGLFIGPFVLVFAVSVFFLVHAWLPKVRPDNAAPRVVEGLLLPAGLEQLSGRSLVDTLQPVLRQAGVYGEVGWVQHLAKENRFIVPVTIPGRRTTVTIDVTKREASIERRTTGLADALVTLHKSPGQHLAAIRMNWFFMRAWRWLADSTVCLTLFIAGSGVYLWYLLQAERRAGTWLLAAGAASFFGIVYALVS